MRGEVLSAVLGRTRPAARLNARAAWLLAAACAVGGFGSACVSAPALEPGPAPVADWRAAAAAAEAQGDARATLAALRLARPEAGAPLDGAHWRRVLVAATAAGDALMRIEARAHLLADEPRNAGLRREQAKDLLRSGAPDLALLCLDAADPAASAVEDRALRAEARFALGQHVDAAREYEAAAADPAAAALAGELWMRASRAWERAGERGAATQAMERALADVDLSERERSALSRLRAFELGKIESVEDARAVLRLHDQAELRLTAARFLASADFAEAIATFGAASTDPDAGVRRVCMRALAERCGPLERSYVAARAAERLHDADVEVRIAALDALAVAGSRGEIPLLLEALDPEDRAQFRAARRALEAVSGHAEAGSLDPPPEERARLQEAWRAWWRNQGGT